MARITGTTAADTLTGGAGDDRIFGFNGTRNGPDTGRIKADQVATGFGGAVFAGAAPGRPDRLFVVEKDSGTIWLLNPDTGARTDFLKIPPAELGKAGEEGLLGLAFHPDYAQNGRFFVHLVNAAGGDRGRLAPAAVCGVRQPVAHPRSVGPAESRAAASDLSGSVDS